MDLLYFNEYKFFQKESGKVKRKKIAKIFLKVKNYNIFFLLSKCESLNKAIEYENFYYLISPF